VPITGSSPRECFATFRGHVAGVVGKLLGPAVHVRLVGVPGSEAAYLEHGNAPFETIPLESRFGRVHFFFRQSLVAERQGRRDWRLSTRRYWYRLQNEPGKAAAVLRWEYVSARERDYAGNRYCTHHLQSVAAVPLGMGELSFEKAHVPTGWVTFEEVFRFLFHELGVEPKCGDEWDRELRDSERRFYVDFTSKRH
jgi:hypothetical protein